MTKLQQFIEAWNGKSNIGNTPENKGECVGLVSVWMDTLNIPHVWGHAKDLFNNAPEAYFTKIKNSLDKFVKAGDIVVWNNNMGGGFGHTAIATGKNNGDAFEVLEQNNPLYSPVRLYTYKDYTNVIGWLVPKNLEVSEPIMNNELNNDLQKKASGFDRIWHAFNFNDITPEDAEEADHLEFVDWVRNNVERAGMWDKLCQKAGINDSSSADFEQLYEVIFKKGEDLNSSLAAKVLLLEEERNRALERQAEAEGKATKADELRAKWKSLYDTKKSEAEVAKNGLTTCSKNLTLCREEHELTWGDLLTRIWFKIKGVKV